MTHAVVEWLLGQSSVTDLVGRNEETDTYKIYPVMVPITEKPPYICVSVTSIRPQRCKGSQTTEETDNVQVDCYAQSYHDAHTLYRVVRSVLDAQSFTSPTDGTVIKADILNARDLSQSEMAELGKRGLWGIISEYEAQVKLGTIT